MKGLGANRSRHLSDTCDPTAGPQEPLCPLAPDPHAAYLLSPTINHYGTLDPHLHHFPVSSPTTLQSDCLLPLNNQLTNSSTFPRLHYTSQAEQNEYAQGFMTQTGSRAGTLTSSMSMGMNLGLGLGAPAMISSGTATISSAAAAKMNRIPANLLDQLERHLPLQRDGFSTLQFHRRSRGSKQRSESPSRIRNLVQSVQKLFAKSQSLEVSAVKGNIAAGQAGDAAKTARRSKSKDRAKTEGTKRRPRPNLSGFWSSDDALEDEPASQPATAGPLAVAYRNPLSMMTLGRAVSDSQAAPRPHPQGYNTIAAHSLTSSKSSGDLKTQSGPVPSGGRGEHNALVKRASWSTLTLSQTRQVLQKGSATVNRTLLKSKSCHGQEMTCNLLKVPAGEWSGTLGKGGGAGEIPCRRMRSGSYVKAMGDTEESEDSDEPPSPKPSPKTAARRQSYLKATHQSLSEQQPPLPPRNCLPSLCEVSTNRSLDNLDCLMTSGEAGLPHWDMDHRFSQGCGTLGQGPDISQVEQGYLGSASYCQLEALDLPKPTCFRSRSHSYLRAIQAGCSQDDDTGSVDSDETPPTTMSISSYTNSNKSSCTAVCKKTPPPIPPRITSKPFIAVTLQSSTESAQDTYLDSQEQRSEVNSQSGRSNSSDSLASSRTGSLVKSAKRSPILPPIPAPREPVALPSARVTTPPPFIVPPPHAPDAKNEPQSLTVTPDEPKAAPKRKLSSIGIQVDCVQPILKEEQTPTTRFQSIGVQVEDGRPLSRFTSMASRQETADAEAQDQSDGKPLENKTRNQSFDGSVHSKPVRPDARCSFASLQENLDPALDPSSLPPPDPSLQAGTGSVNGAADQSGGVACLRDGRGFQKLLQAETERMEAWCQQMDHETKDKQLSEEVLGKVRSAVGSAQLLMSKKFKQFQGLCEQNLDATAQPRPTAQDLAGFWDLLQLSIEDISMKFDELHLLRSNDWKIQDKKEEKAAPAHTPKKTVKVKTSGMKEKSSDSVANKQRQEARKRLMAAKRAVSERQNSATESAESIEIYVPEAQTRL